LSPSNLYEYFALRNVVTL